MFNKIVVFDTETSGLNAGYNVILSISWQVLDSELNKVSEESRYFKWPKSKSRVSPEAIGVNGLTEKRLAELGTCNKKKALQEFARVIANADLLVAHNGSFDRRFVLADAEEEGVDIDMSHELYDTMLEMTEFCAIPGYHGGYKWPRLSELADALGVDTSDIDWHQSAADVEVTVRCFREICEMKRNNI